MAVVLDFADLTEAELAAAIPIVWGSSDEVHPAAHFPDILPRTSGRIVPVLRWGDERADSLLADWHRYFAQQDRRHWPGGDKRDRLARLGSDAARVDAEVAKHADYRMHEQRIAVLVDASIYEVHLIPKSLGTHVYDESSDCDECGLDGMEHVADEFDPMLYHDHLADVAKWNESADSAGVKLRGCNHHRHMFYVEFDRYVGSFRMGVDIASVAAGEMAVHLP